MINRRKAIAVIAWIVCLMVSFWFGTHFLAQQSDDEVTVDGIVRPESKVYETRSGSLIVETRRAYVFIDTHSKDLVAFPQANVIKIGTCLFAASPLMRYVSGAIPLDDWDPRPSYHDSIFVFHDLDNKKIEVRINIREGG
jgi:hypothetical protein